METAVGGQWPFTSRARLKRACMVVIAPGARRGAGRTTIKGPGIRLDLDVRRVWRCPSCQRVLKTAGHITSRTCPIDGAWMQLDDSAQRAAGRLNFPSIGEADGAPDRLEDASTEPAYDGDDDRPRKQSRKQKRRRRQKSGETVSEQERPEQEQEPGTDGSESVT
ncbi:MAG: hypothetical protein CM1200mP2_05100 [Planctomycetaceae bacterium]|nr:MAG: hypothetical protein CM1200mP2_05100 [Planctomycetaceae bacterium]